MMDFPCRSLSHLRTSILPHCTAPFLCDVSVHITVLRSPCQVFPFYKSLNALFDDHGAGEEARLQLLSHLSTSKSHYVKWRRFQLSTPDKKNKIRLTSATRTLCCIFFLDFMMRTMAASIITLRSSSTFCCVSFLSGSDSPCLAATRKRTGYKLMSCLLQC